MITTKWLQGNEDLTDIYEIRRIVFIDEQKVDEQLEMIPSEDTIATHLAVYEDGKVVATGRIIIVDGDFILGRIAVLKDCRKKGYGEVVVKALIEKGCAMGAGILYIHAQVSAQGFYEKMGFAPFGGIYDEAGIPHIHMRKER